MTNSYDVDHGLSQDAPGPLEPIEVAAPDTRIRVEVEPDPRGVSVGVWQGSHCIYSGAHPIPAPASPVSTVADEGEKDERSDTYGMNLGERIAHVGGRTNAQGYTEFGSPMAVNALIQHVLRDIDWTRQDDDGAYQARYRLPGGQWSSWGHVVCGVKGHEQELRYLPDERLPAPAAGDAQAVAALAELVACDRLKKQIASMQACVLETEDDVQELDAMMTDLARRQPAAWDAARAVLAAQRQGDA